MKQGTMFAESSRIGKMGEVLFLKEMERFPMLSIQDTTQLEEFQNLDVDFVVKNTQTQTTTLVEIKCDTYRKSGNFFIEEFSDLEHRYPGWLKKSNADIIVYIFINGLDAYERNVYFLDLKALKSLDWTQFRRMEVKGQGRFKAVKTTTGFLLSITKARQLGLVKKEYAWSHGGAVNNFQRLG